MRLNRQRVLQLYDTRTGDIGSHVAALTALMGEDLLLALLRSYWDSQGFTSRIVDYRCKGSGKKGHRLDAWVLRERGPERVLFQTEIKNWAAYSLGEHQTALDASEDSVKARARGQWDYYFEQATIPIASVAKVLTEGMRRPAGFDGVPVLPLVCFWFVISQSPPECYSIQQRIGSSAFPELHVFSGSLYLRSLRDPHVDLSAFQLPRLKERMRIFNEMFVQGPSSV